MRKSVLKRNLVTFCLHDEKSKPWNYLFRSVNNTTKSMVSLWKQFESFYDHDSINNRTKWQKVAASCWLSHDLLTSRCALFFSLNRWNISASRVQISRKSVPINDRIDNASRNRDAPSISGYSPTSSCLLGRIRSTLANRKRMLWMYRHDDFFFTNDVKSKRHYEREKADTSRHVKKRARMARRRFSTAQGQTIRPRGGIGVA